MYWKTSQSNIQELGESLDKYAIDIRHEMQQMADLGKIPKIIFVYHKTDTVPMPTAKEIEEILTYQRENSLTCEEDIERDECQYANDPYAHIKCLKPRTDVLGFDRERAMKQVLQSIAESHPTHEIRS